MDELSVSVLSTEDVIKKFCHDLVKHQVLKYCYTCTLMFIYILMVLSKNEYGVLHISHIYDSTKKALVVEVLFAERIPGLDRSGESTSFICHSHIDLGKSDPYVKLYLLPATIFIAVEYKPLKTTVQKQTLDPIFNETFEL